MLSSLKQFATLLGRSLRHGLLLSGLAVTLSTSLVQAQNYQPSDRPVNGGYSNDRDYAPRRNDRRYDGAAPTSRRHLSSYAPQNDYRNPRNLDQDTDFHNDGRNPYHTDGWNTNNSNGFNSNSRDHFDDRGYDTRDQDHRNFDNRGFDDRNFDRNDVRAPRPTTRMRPSSPRVNDSLFDENRNYDSRHNDSRNYDSRNFDSRYDDSRYDNRGPAFPGLRDDDRMPRFEAPLRNDYRNEPFSNPSYSTPSNTAPSYSNPLYTNPSFINPSNTSPSFTNTPALQSPAGLPLNSNAAADVQQRITRRYQTAGFESLRAMTPQAALTLYGEVLAMIDERHLEPSPLDQRVRNGYANLLQAVQNPDFQNANRVRLTAEQANALRQSMSQLAGQSPLRSNQDAVNLAGWTANTAQQQFGIPASAVILEFVYGATETLDKYSTLVPPERQQGASLQLENSVVGIGVQVEAVDAGLSVTKVISGGPAQQAGLKAGDVIVAVGNQQMAGMNLDQSVNLITGPAGSQVQLVVQRASQAAFTVALPRRQVEIKAVTEVQMLPNSVGYFKLEKFTQTSSAEMDQALWTLHQQGMQSLIIDLRGNPGGLLTAAVEISDKFLPSGVIVSTKGRSTADNTTEQAKQAETWKVPLVVVVDHNSASASEIFAAAIQDNRRGVIVGRTSYGKGTVQTQFPLRTAGTSLRITTAKFYAPSGREMANQGVTPDVAVTEVAGWSAGNGMDRDIQAAVEVAGRNMQSFPNVSQTRPAVPGGV